MCNKRTAVVKTARKSVNEQNLSLMSYKWEQKQQQQKQWMDNIIFTAMNSAINEQNHAFEKEKNVCLFIYFWLAVLVC